LRLSLPIVIAASIVLIGVPLPIGAREPFEAFVTEIIDLDMVSGLAVAVVRGDSTIYEKCFGFADAERTTPITPETVFYPVDLSKALMGQAAAILHDRGEIDLDASLAEILPELTLPEPLSPLTITLRDLLAGSHDILAPPGLRFRIQTGNYTRATLIELMHRCRAETLGRHKDRDPYVASVLSGLALETVLDRSVIDLVREEILEPCGMNSTAHDVTRVPPEDRAQSYHRLFSEITGVSPPPFPYDPPCDDAIFPGWAVATTLRDLTRWLTAMVTAGSIGGRPVLPAAAIQATLNVHEPIEPDPRADFRPIGRSLGWVHFVSEGKVRVAPSRSPFNFSFVPEHDVGIVVLTNGGTGSVVAMENAVGYLITEVVYATLVEKLDVRKQFIDSLALLRKTLAQTKTETKGSLGSAEPPSGELALPREAYAGIFGHEIYGEMLWKGSAESLGVRIGCVDAVARIVNGEEHMVWAPGVGFCEFQVDDSGWVHALKCSGQTFTRLDH
jgi:CubicO group peptidase (beta-lactamase class C family)